MVGVGRSALTVVGQHEDAQLRQLCNAGGDGGGYLIELELKVAQIAGHAIQGLEKSWQGPCYVVAPLPDFGHRPKHASAVQAVPIAHGAARGAVHAAC